MEILKDFKIKVQLPVEWGDVDVYGHINNVTYFRYFQEARVEYYKKVGIRIDVAGNEIGAVLKSISSKFIVPLDYPDIVTIGAKVTSIVDSEITMEHYVLSEKKGLVTIGESVLVIYDFKLQKKLDVPQNILTEIEKIEGIKFN
ncbi:MAG: acyl-CoA thioesterase [Ignavibacteriae bacterium]|nr:acyl-CoA thioesterase [Ignavibacteriota bacterium]